MSQAAGVRNSALDGMRAVAVMAVVVFHAGLSWLPGGFLGVDVFFVLSGYLITTLLLAEVDRTGRLDLVAFWGRRARRLLPALIVLVAVVSGVSPVVLPPAEITLVRDDALSALAYLANWRMILRGTDYFAQTAAPSPLEHTWSLAIEEQFYLLWPLVLLLLVRATPVRWRGLVAVVTTAALGAAASVAVGWSLAAAGRDLNRVYFGSDTRAVSILVGVALAGVLALGPGRVAGQCRRLLGGAAAVATVVLMWLFSHAQGDDPQLYHGQLLLAALAVAAVLAHAVLAPQSVTARVLSLPPLPALGRISYGVYLWHWPLSAWLNGERTGLHGASLLLFRCLATVAVAALSYVLIEQPIRAGHWQLLRQPRRTLTAAAMVVCATAGALVALTPRVSSGTGPVLANPARALELPAVAPPVSLDVAPPVSLDSQLDGHGAAAPAQFSPPLATHHHLPGRPVTVEVFGDSLARSLVNALPAKPGLIVHDDTMLGCGLLVDSPFRYFGSIQEQRPECAGWPRLLQQVATTDGVDVVMILVGRWETMDRVHDGRWTHLGDPAFDDYVRGELDRAVGIAASGGARVVLATEPFNRRGERPDGELWPEDEPDRVDRWNALLRDVAAENPETVQLIELGARLCPEGHFTRTVNGIAVRSDGVHLTPEGVHWLAPWLLPQLAAAG